MLKNLLKYEFRATARTYGGIYLALLFVAGLLGFTFRVENDFTESRVFDVLFTLYDLLAVALVVVTIITVIHRFTRNLLGREGYLMHTLPVTEAQLVGSKLISSAVWLLASAVVGVVSLVVMFCVGADFTQLDLSNLLDDWAALRTSFEGDLLAILLWTALLCYARMLCTMLCIYAACMVGHLFRAHNGVASVGAFFLMSWGQGRVENLLNAGGFVRILMGSAGDTIVSEAANHSTLIFFAASFAITAVFGAVYFILTCWLMKNKLNLE